MAVLAVFAFHTSTPHAGGGWIGVEIFFVLSGYLITGLLVTEWHNDKSVRLRRFYIRRLARLYPALALLLILGMPFYKVLGDGGTFAGYARTALDAGLYVQDFVWGFSGAKGGYGHTWSLAVEEQFYLVWPPIVLLVLRRGWSASGLAICVAALSLAGTALFESHRADVPGAFYLPWTQAAPLLLGCAIGASRKRSRPALAKVLGISACIGLGALVLAADQLSRRYYLSLEIGAAAVLSCALIVGVEGNARSVVARALAMPPLVFVGKISYGVYVYHVLIITVLMPYLPFHRSVNTLVELILTLALSTASFYLLEQPVRDFARSRWSPNS